MNMSFIAVTDIVFYYNSRVHGIGRIKSFGQVVSLTDHLASLLVVTTDVAGTCSTHFEDEGG